MPVAFLKKRDPQRRDEHAVYWLEAWLDWWKGLWQRSKFSFEGTSFRKKTKKLNNYSFRNGTVKWRAKSVCFAVKGLPPSFSSFPAFAPTFAFLFAFSTILSWVSLTVLQMTETCKHLQTANQFNSKSWAMDRGVLRIVVWILQVFYFLCPWPCLKRHAVDHAS